MTITVPQKAFILAGGAGRRLRPYTETTPKPLLPLGGQTLLERTLRNAAIAGVTDIHMSLYFRVDQFKEHIAQLQANDTQLQALSITVTEEEELLGTGGSVMHALKEFRNEPFFLLQSNIIWDEAQSPLLSRMAAQFDPEAMDALAAILPIGKAPFYHGRGDYFYDAQTHLLRYNYNEQEAPYVAAAVRLIQPSLFDRAPDGAFPFRTVLAQAQETNRLSGIVHDGDWWAIDTKEQFLAAQRHFTTQNS